MARLHSLFLAIVLLTLFFGLIEAQTEGQTPPSISTRPSLEDAPPFITSNSPSPKATGNSQVEEEELEAATEPESIGSTIASNSKSSTPPASNKASSSNFITSTTASGSSSSTSSAPILDPTTDDMRTTDDWYQPPEEKLPLQPRVTVAFGFGGALLILTGTIIGFVGIQHRLIYIFLSVVYLVSLSVSVLILYVINPPVSDAVQGAYLVGIVAPGLILGGGAMVFSNLTEGLGCLLGGFCLSMWLLCLKPGGLLTNTTSIVIFICVFSAVLWSTAYIKWISTYGLIFSLAFSGATAIILGIDCFSRAGLKELWVYIWRLNDNIFPLNTNTYPMTRGIKVEIAGIVIFTILGILVQWKLWGFIKKKHEARRAERDAERRVLEREEEMIGRRVNWETTKQRERWEEVYEQEQLKNGGTVRQLSLGSDSGVGDMNSKRLDSSSTLAAGKRGVPQIQVHEDAIEMSHLPNPSRSNSWVGGLNDQMSKVVYTSGGADEEVKIVKEPKVNRKSKDIDALAALEGGERTGSRSAKRDSKSKRVSGSPDTPFPSLDVAVGGNTRASRGTDRLSADSRGSRLLHRLSHNSTTGKRRSTSKKGLREDEDEWDATSSIAATIDDLTSDIDFADLRSLPSGTPRASMVLDKAINASDPDPGLASKELDSNGDPSDWSQNKQKPTMSAADIFHMAGPTRSLTKDVLPAAAPRVATTFRTEEWRKRLDDAEAPAVPEIATAVTPTKAHFSVTPPSPSSPVSQTIPEDEVLDHAQTKNNEAPAPVNIDALKQTAVTGAVAPAPHRPRSAQAHMRRKSGDQNSYRASMQHTPSSTLTPSSSRPASQGANVGMVRSSSYGSLATPKQQYRASSNPLYVLQEKDDDSMSLRERQSILRKSSMPLNSHVQASPSPSPCRTSMQQQQLQYPPELQHLASNRRQSATRMQPSPAPLSNRTSTPGYGNPFSMETMNRGVPRPQFTDLEMMEHRRLQMLEERRMTEARKKDEERRREEGDRARVDRYRMSLREGRGEEVHREGLRRMMSGAPRVEAEKGL